MRIKKTNVITQDLFVFMIWILLYFFIWGIPGQVYYKFIYSYLMEQFL